jgi:NitT/TauT family transport system substrate-binding protein
MKAYLAEIGLPDKSYEVLAIGSGAQAYSIMKAGQVDAVCFSTGLAAALEILGANLKYYTRQEASGVIVGNDKFIKEKPDAATKALQGIILSQTFMEVNPQASVRYYWELAGKPKGLSEEEALRDGEIYIKRTAEMWKSYKDPKPWGLMSDRTWTDLMEFKPIAATFPSEADLKNFVSSLYTNELIEGANKVDLSIAINAAKALPGAK